MLVITRKLAARSSTRSVLYRSLANVQFRRGQVTTTQSDSGLDTTVNPIEKEACLYIDSVFPVRLGAWE